MMGRLRGMWQGGPAGKAEICEAGSFDISSQGRVVSGPAGIVGSRLGLAGALLQLTED
jgi:hypothetical protein